MHHIVEAGLDHLGYVAKIRPALAEFRPMVRRREPLPIGPLDMVHDMAAVGAAIKADRHEPRLTGHEAGALLHQFEHLVLTLWRKLDGRDLGHDARIVIGHGALPPAGTEG